MTTLKLPSLIGIRTISKGRFNKVRVKPWITVFVLKLPSAISMSEVVSSVIGGILSIAARDMDTKLLSALELNNTLARCWFRRNIPIDSGGWPFIFAVPGQMTHLIASMTLDSTRSLIIIAVAIVVTVVLVVFDAIIRKVDDDQEASELKKCLEIVLDDEDDVTIDATPLSSMSSTIIDYIIHKEGRKSYFQFIRVDGSSQM
nr:hypothetical protein [Tanacetum cinerariifolium]